MRLDALTAAQQTAALAVIQAATGTTANDGFDEIQLLRAADDNLAANGGGSAYGSGVYLIAFLGTPSLTGTWQLQFGGHHLATNITYGNGSVTGATPKFEGVEPLTFTTANVLPTGTVAAPLSNEAAAMQALLNSLTTAQNPTAPGSGLQVKLATPATVARYTLRNVLGQTFATKTFAGDAVQVSTAGLPAGTYLLSRPAEQQRPQWPGRWSTGRPRGRAHESGVGRPAGRVLLRRGRCLVEDGIYGA